MCRKLFKRVISIILAIVLVLDLSTSLAYAIGRKNTSDTGELSPERLYDPDRKLASDSADVKLDKEIAELINNLDRGDILEASDDTVLFENTDKRDVNSKSYRLTNGCSSIIMYPVTIHEKDAAGTWIEIDNNLKEEKDKSGRNVFSAENLHSKTTFFSFAESGGFFTIETKDGYIIWGLKADGIQAEGSYAEPEIKKGYEKLQIKSISGVLSYKGVLPGIDLNYQLLGYNVEEAVVINTREAAESILSDGLVYSLSLEGYRAEQKSEEIYIYVEGCNEPEYVISAPYMEDAGLEESVAIKVVFSEDETGYIVKVYPDSEWLLSEDRKYPVIIDPTITRYADVTHIDTCTVYSQSPNSRMYGYGNLMVGKEASSYQKLRAFIKFDMPSSMTSTDVVVDGTLRLTQRGYEPTNSSYTVWVDAYRNTTNLSASTVTWNLLNGHFDTSRVIDNRKTTKNTNGNTSTFDITALVKEWQFNGNNYGVTLMSQNEDAGYRYVKYYSAHFTGVSQTLLPTVIITYVDQSGLEDYLSYHSAGSGSMGTVSIGDASGSLIYAYDDLSLSGEYMPLSIQHVYDHAKRQNADLAGTSMHFGLGFRLNLSQRIESTSVSGYPYKYIDTDGTSHFFKLKSGSSGAVGSVYTKEFETTTTLKKTSSGYTLDFNGDLVYYFNTSGLLTSITDTSNNKHMELTYTNNRLTTVTDGAGRSATLTYNSSGYLTQITDPAGRTTTYVYTDNRLTQITEPDGSTIGLAYSSVGNGGYVLSRITDIDGSYLDFEYNTTSPYRIKTVTEYGTSGGEGGKLTWTYASGSTTITDRDGLSQTMLFDRSGHTVSVRDGAGNAVFGSYKNTDDNNKHSLSLSSNLQGTIRNYLTNHSFEQDSYSPWAAYLSSGVGSISLDTSQEYIGSKSLCVTSTSSSGEYGVYQDASISGVAGVDVTFSAWVNITSIAPDIANDAGLVFEVSYKDAGGNWIASRSAALKVAANGWQRMAHTVSVPSSAQSAIRVRIMFVSSTGTAYIDCAQLETGAVANRYNLLENGYFKEATGSTSVSSWTGESLDTSYDKVVSGRDGNGFTIKGNTSYTKGLVQTIPVSGNVGDSYAYSAWAKAAAIGPVDKDSGSLRDFAILIRFKKSNGSSETVKTTFDALVTDWQYLAGTAVAPCNYTSIQIVLCYYYQKNFAVFDDIQVHREGFGTAYTYDSAGRVHTATDSMGRTMTYAYAFTDRPEVSSITYPDGTQKTYTYDSSTHKLLSETDANNETAYYSYDSSWNNTKVHMTTGYIDLNSGVKEFGVAGYVTKETDPFGNETQYAYNTNKGLLTSITEPNNTTTIYSYNTNNDLLNGITKGSSSVSYSYTNRRLTDLSHNGNGVVSYNLVYDQFGNRTDVKVGSQSLASNEYAAYNGELTKTTYGNGTYTEPVYDALKRQVGLKVNGTQKYRWHYGADGKIGLEEDLTSGISWRYLYDNDGNVAFASNSKGDLYSNAYNEHGKLAETSTVSDGTLIRNAYTYNEDTGFLDESDYFDGEDTIGWTKYGFLDFERTKTIMVNQNQLVIYKDIDYKVAADGVSETMLPEHVLQSAYIYEGSTGLYEDYIYSYDNMGNISSIQVSLDGDVYTDLASYLFDDLNQIVRENNASANKTWVYSYDTGGNILSVSEYNYTTGSLGTPISTKYYSYGDSNWKDKLTGYDGQIITYDAIGNPLSYKDGWSFAWQDGRQLASASNTGTNITYSYNSAGQRISKTVNGSTTEYTLSGSQVVMASTGNTKVLYFYDSFGTPVAFRIKEGNTKSDYYYYNNIQGDIIGIIDAYGNRVVEYDYDAWGNVISISGSLASTIGQSNPYRYRGYWFDSETGFYYLQSRYYDPQIGRFINADEYPSTGQDIIGCNMFAYCGNNPVSRKDQEGTLWNLVIGTLVGAVLGGASAAIASYKATGSINWSSVVIGAVAGGLSGLISATGIPPLGQAVTTGFISSASNFANQTIVEKKRIQDVDYLDVAIDGFVTAGCSFLGSAITKKAEKAADKLIKKGVKKVTSGLNKLNAGSKYYKGALRRGVDLIQRGAHDLHSAQGKSSVIGSISNFVISTFKTLFKKG